MFEPGPTPRLQGRYLVVAPGTALPKICVRTGRQDDLMEIDDHVRTDSSVARAVGALGALLAYQEAPLRYYLRRDEFARIKRWRRRCNLAILFGIGVLAVGIFTVSSSLVVAGFALVCVFVAVHSLLPSPISVAAVWGNQVFLLKIPPEITAQVMQGAASNSRSRP